jgi:hypothetical protein
MELRYSALLFMPLVISHHLLNAFVQLANKRGLKKSTLVTFFVRLLLPYNNVVSLKENLKEKEKLVACSRWAPDTKTNWPTDRRSQYNLKFNLRHYTANYRPVLSSERAPYMKNKESNCPKGARHQDEMAD